MRDDKAPISLFRADDPFLSADDAALVKQVISYSKAEEVRVDINSGWSGNTRFARGEITTSGGTTDTTVTISATVGKRRASTTTNVLEPDALKRSVELADRLAKLSPEDPELMPELGPQQYHGVDGYFQRTADLSPEVRATAVKKVFDAIYETGKSAGELSGRGIPLGGCREAFAIGNNKGFPSPITSRPT